MAPKLPLVTLLKEFVLYMFFYRSDWNYPRAEEGASTVLFLVREFC